MIITDPDVDPFQATSNPVSGSTLKQYLESGSDQTKLFKDPNGSESKTLCVLIHKLMQCAYQ
jgi:hypothetical protein